MTTMLNTTRSLIALSAGVSSPSTTRLLTDRLVEATQEAMARADLPVDVEVVELSDLAHDVTSVLTGGYASEPLEELVERLAGAHGLIAATPTFTASFSGMFKSFLDVLAPESLAGLPVLIAATGGTDRHSLVLDYAIRPVFNYLHADVVPTGVFAATSEWGSSSGLGDRISRAGAQLAERMRTTSRMVADSTTVPAGFSPTGTAVRSL